MPKMRPFTDEAREAIKETILEDVSDLIDDALDDMTLSSHICSGDYDGPRLTVGQAKFAKKQIYLALIDAIEEL